MAFSDFKTVPEVQKKFGIRHIENDFIKIEDGPSPSEQFLQELEFSRQYILDTSLVIPSPEIEEVLA